MRQRPDAVRLTNRQLLSDTVLKSDLATEVLSEMMNRMLLEYVGAGGDIKDLTIELSDAAESVLKIPGLQIEMRGWQR